MREIRSLGNLSLESTRYELDLPSFVNAEGDSEVNLVDFRFLLQNTNLTIVESSATKIVLHCRKCNY